MKRLLLLLITSLLAFALVACGESDTDSKASGSDTEEKAADTEEKESEKVFGIGDTAEIDGVKITLKNVTTTDERNQFADTDPAQVVKLEYEVENNSDDEITVGMDLEVYDGDGNKGESYPLDNTLDTLATGKKIQAVGHFGVEEGPIEIHFSPFLSFDSEAAVFEAEIE